MQRKSFVFASVAGLALAASAGLLLTALTPSALYAQAAPAAASGAANLPAGPGRDVFVERCSTCHAVSVITAKPRAATEWPGIIQTMIGQGAQVNAAQAEAIRGYLVANFSAVPSDAGPAAALQQAAVDSLNAPSVYPRPAGENQWPAYGGGAANQNFSTLRQITPANVSRLKVAWTYRYGAGKTPVDDQGLDYRFEVTPLIIGGVMYLSTPASPAKPSLKASVTALRPETGEVIWKFESPLNIHGRGLAYWPGDATTAPRLIFGTDQGYVMAVDMTTGKLAKGFGWGGRIDAYAGVTNEIVGETRRDAFTVPNPVSVYKDLIILSSRPGEGGPPGPRGDIRAFNVKTGEHVWDFHTIPQPGEANHETWPEGTWKGLTGANVWSTMTLDVETGTVFGMTGNANAPPNVLGPQLYANTLLALDANTGKLKWFKQLVHRDIWDWDSPTPAVLMDIQQNGRTVKAIAATGKQSLFYLFDRNTGESLNGFTERPIPQPTVPNPHVPLTQPFPDAPGPLARTQMTRDEIPALMPGMKAACEKIWDDNKIVSLPLFGPRRDPNRATITYPSSTGGPNWGGGAYNPDTKLFFINLKNTPSFSMPSNQPLGQNHALNVPRPATAGGGGGGGGGGGNQVQFNYRTEDGITLSCGALPWGELVALNVETKQIVWRTTLGRTEGIGAIGETTGTANLGGALATRSGLVFVGATNDRRFRAFDAKTGKKLWETEMEASGAATPISYMGKNGKQYVVIAAGGGTSVGEGLMSDTVVAYTLP